MILGTIARKHIKGDSVDNYLEDRVSFSEDKVMDADNKAVMMAWEKPLMEAHAKAVCSQGGHILNIGFGMGLVDTAIQQYSPVSHTIVEAHPEVYDRMCRSGWKDKKNVKIVFGRWQDVLSDLDTYDGKIAIHEPFQFSIKNCLDPNCYYALLVHPGVNFTVLELQRGIYMIMLTAIICI